MKRTILLVCALVLCLVLVACGGEAQEASVVGTWELENTAVVNAPEGVPVPKQQVTFNEDLTGEVTLIMGENVNAQSFTYVTADGQLTITMDDAQLMETGAMFSGAYDLEGDSLTIHTQRGDALLHKAA